MIKTKKILIALAVIGANVLYNMPLHTALAEPDYTITCGSETVNSTGDSGSTYEDVVGNTSLTGSPLSGIDMVVRRGTYNGTLYGESIKMVTTSADGVNISNNKLTIDSGTFNHWIYGVHYDGYDSTATFENNHITLNSGNYEIIYGVYVKYGSQATGNTVTIEGGTSGKPSFHYGIYAANIECSGNATLNKITINGGNFEQSEEIVAAFIKGTGEAIGNETTINGGTFGISGWNFDIKAADIGWTGSGGGNVKNNILNIAGGIFASGAFYGGSLRGSSNTYVVSGNKVNVTAGTFNNSISIFGGYAIDLVTSGKEISENKVTIKDVTLPASSAIYGGYAKNVTVKKNSVTIENATLGDTSNVSSVYGGWTNTKNAEENKVTIDSGNFDNVLIVGGKSEAAEVLNNSVILNGGNFTGGTKIVAGIGVNDSDKFSGNSISLAGSNALDLSGASLMGYDGTNAGVANSTLNVGRANVAVKDIQNFGTIAFDLSGVSSDAVVLKMGATGSAYDLLKLDSATISVSGITLTGNDFIVLMQNVNDGSFAGTVDDGGKGGAIKVLTTTSGYDLIYYVGTEPTAPKADYTITGTTVINSPHSDGHTYSTEIIGNTDTLASELSNIDMVVRRGTYENTIYGVKYEGDDSDTVISGNKVTIRDGSFKEIYVAYGKNGQVTGNTITIEGGTFAQGSGCEIYAGYVKETGKVEGNKLNINGGDVGKSKTIYAGNISGAGDAIDNEITITEGKIGGDGYIKIYGAEFNKGIATGNKVNISGGEFGRYVDIYGASLSAGYPVGDANTYIGENEVNITGGTFDHLQGVYGGSASSYTAKSVEKNKVNIKNVTIKPLNETHNINYIYGGRADKALVKGNSVTIENVTFEKATFDNEVLIYGGYTATQNAEGNIVTIKSGNFGAVGTVYGGNSYYKYSSYPITGKDAKYNRVEILDGVTMEGDAYFKIVYGGVGKDNVEFNEVSIGSGAYRAIVGGVNASNNGSFSVSNNSVKMTGGTLVGGTPTIVGWDSYDGHVYGAIGSSNGTTVTENTVELDGVMIKDSIKIYGAFSLNNATVKNSVTVANLECEESKYSTIYGGYSGVNSSSENIVTIKSGAWEKVYGGYSSSQDVSGNIVNIYSGNLKGDIYGGHSENGNAIGNIVNIYDGNFEANSSIHAGRAGGDGTSLRADGNVMNILGGTFADNCSFYGGYSSGTSSDNTLNLETKMSGTALMVGFFQTLNFTLPSDIADDNTMISTNKLRVDIPNGGEAKINVYAANGVELFENDVITLISANNTSDSEPSITGNFVGGKIFGDQVTEVTYGKEYKTDIAKITIDDNSIKLTMLGYYFISDSWYGTTAGGSTRKKSEALAVGGKLIIAATDSSFAKTKYFYGGYSNANDIEVKDNIVNVNNGTFGPEMEIFGGYSENGPANNNTVNINGGTFNDGYKLYGGSGTSSSNNTLNLNIKMGGKAKSVSHFQTMNFVLPAGTANGQTMLSTETLKFDDTKTIINVDASGTTLNNGDIITLIASDSAPTGVWQAGNITGAEGAISLSNNKLLFTIGGSSAVSEDQQKAPVEGVATAAVIVNASADLASGEGMASLVANTADGATDTFGAMSAGSSKYKTGSHVDVDGWGVLVGAGKTKDWKDGRATTYGLFFEYGKGDFDTYNGNVHGDGNSENKGVGIMARHKLKNNTYYEGNIRYGKQETEWSQSELGGYDTDSRYYGISVGMGHIYQAGKNEIDVYGRYTYGHVGACDATLKTGEYHFDSVKSHRVRVGGKYNFKQKNSNAKPYVGLAWEHEFKGETRASISGVGEAPAPSMKGNTGILEVGCDWNVSKKWTVGLGANAYVGKRKGWDGMARVFYNF